jgi:phosphoribosyl-AMP cyclohydrolase
VSAQNPPGRSHAVDVRFDDAGLVTAVVQDASSRDVLMVAWMDATALATTRSSGLATFYSRSRREQWVKGATSGNYLRVRELRTDCDGDTLLLLVDPDGPACHTGDRTCFDDRTLPLTTDQPDLPDPLHRATGATA